jgi:hypothetical protein
MKITLQLPIPEKALWPNDRINAFVKRQAIRRARHAAVYEAMRCLTDLGMTRGPKWERAKYYVTLYKTTTRFPDEDNLIAALKPYLDGIQDAGIVRNDKGLRIAGTGYVVVPSMPRVEIDVWEDKQP